MTRRGPKRKSIFGRFGCFIVEQDVRLKTNFTFLAWIVSKIRRFTGDSLLEDKSLFRLNLFRVHARAENIFSYFNFCGNQVLVARGLVSKTKKCSFRFQNRFYFDWVFRSEFKMASAPSASRSEFIVGGKYRLVSLQRINFLVENVSSNDRTLSNLFTTVDDCYSNLLSQAQT